MNCLLQVPNHRNDGHDQRQATVHCRQKQHYDTRMQSQAIRIEMII